MKVLSDPLVVLALAALFFVASMRFDWILVVISCTVFPVLGAVGFISIWYSNRELDQVPKRYRWLLEKFNL